MEDLSALSYFSAIRPRIQLVSIAMSLHEYNTVHSRIRTEHELQTFLFVYYPDQHVHNIYIYIYIYKYIYINNILYIVSDPIGFDAHASSSGSLILLLG
jgi:hypothetical protein